MREHPDFDHGVIDSLSAHIAVLNQGGEIISVNEAWSRFAEDNGRPAEESVGVGSNYIDICKRSAAAGDEVATDALDGILTVLEGHQSSFRMEYPCHAPDEFRWFLLNVTKLADGKGVVIAHEDITTRRLAEMALQASHEKLERRVRDRTEDLERTNQALRIEIAGRRTVEAELRQAAAVFESANEAIVIANAECRIVAANQAFIRVTGYDASEVQGMDFSLLWSAQHRTGFSHEIAIALKAHGRWQGETWKRRKNGELYPALESISRVCDDEGRTARYVSTFSDISAIKDAEDRLHALAHHDPLTGLANRLQFTLQLDAAIERANRHQGRFALLFIDLDRFKLVNDTLSHVAGDRLLTSVAQRLETLVRGEDTVARWGGDEFVVIAEGLAHAEDAALLARKIHESVKQPVDIGEDNVAASVSIGISIFPEDATESAELIKMADSAMYHAKDTGRNRYQFYRSELTTKAVRYLALHSELRTAVQQRAFTLQYQPLVSLVDGHIDGFEALLRWQHPKKGTLLPESFLHVAEDTGLIHPIGEWVLRTACDQIRAWQEAGIPLPRIAVNISGREVLHGNLGQRITEIVRESGLSLDELALDLEIIENLQQAGEPTVQALRALRDIGLGLTIDDFGTGYSSLNLLRHLPVDTLKIDRSFIADVPESSESCSVVIAILALGRSLRLRVIAEGVENEQQRQFLSNNGCELAQGYFLGKPVDADAVAALLAEQISA